MITVVGYEVRFSVLATKTECQIDYVVFTCELCGWYYEALAIFADASRVTPHLKTCKGK